jgi:hypothetical protein
VTVAARIVGLNRGIRNPAAISGLQTWWEADNVSVASAQPNTISGLQLWLKADALVLNDADPVATWTDSSGNGYNATQATGAKQPLYKTAIVNSKPVVRFDGINDVLQILGAGYLACTNNIGAVTLFVVAKATASGVGQSLVEISTNVAATPRLKLSIIAANKWEIDARRLDADSVNVLTANSTLPSAWECVTARRDYTNARGHLYLQGGTNNESTGIGTTGSTSATNSADAFIGGGSTTPSAPYSGDVAEIVVYNRYLTDIERMSVEKYLCDKYGLTAIGCPYVDGDAVNVWIDSSGNDYGARAVPVANRPTYKTNIVNGKPVVRFDGTNDNLKTLLFAAALTQPMTYVVVARETDLSVDTNNFLDNISGASTKFSGTYLTHPTNPSMYLIDSTTGIYGGSNADTNWHVYTVNWDATDIARKDGVTQVSGNTGSGGATGISIGATNGASKFMHGDFAAALVYNRALTNVELNLIGRYYAAKYGITWTTV